MENLVFLLFIYAGPRWVYQPICTWMKFLTFEGNIFTLWRPGRVWVARLRRVGTLLHFLATGFLIFNIEGNSINERFILWEILS